MSRHPEVKWAQRVDKVFLTVLLADAKDAKVNLDPEGVFSFSGKAGFDNNLYEIKLELFDKVNVEESKIHVGVRNIFCILEKSEKLWWKKLLRGDGKPPHYVKVDWDKWVDEDEDTGTDNPDLGGMDFSKFGGMGGDMDFSNSVEWMVVWTSRNSVEWMVVWTSRNSVEWGVTWVIWVMTSRTVMMKRTSQKLWKKRRKRKLVPRRRRRQLVRDSHYDDEIIDYVLHFWANVAVRIMCRWLSVFS